MIESTHKNYKIEEITEIHQKNSFKGTKVNTIILSISNNNTSDFELKHKIFLRFFN